MTHDRIFKYCPVCRDSVIFTGSKMTCDSCDLEYYVNPSPCNAVLISKGNSILLVRRKLDPQKGKLDFAGGFIERGENVEESIKREIQEELGSKLMHLSYFRSYADTYEFKGITYATLGIVFTAELEDNAVITPADDVSEYIYVDKNNIPYDEIAFPSVARALAEYVNSQ